MTQHSLQFLADQAAPGIIFTQSNDEAPVAPGNRAGWSSASFSPTASDRRADLSPDGGHWVGTVHMLADDIFQMTATYFPSRGEVDNVQLTGPIMSRQPESAIAIVGGGGKYAGARGQARCVMAISDQGTPLYRYELSFEL